MSTDENKAVIRRYIEEIRNRGRNELISEIISPDYDSHIAGRPLGPEGMLAMDAVTRTAFPDFQFTIEELIAEGDTVVDHWTIRGTHLGVWRGVAPTGKSIVHRGVTVFTLKDGKITGRYGYTGDLDLLAQMGVTLP